MRGTVGSRSLLCRHRDCELEIPLYRPHRFFDGDYGVSDGGVALSDNKLMEFVRVCSGLAW